MKKTILAAAFGVAALASFGQSDTTTTTTVITHSSSDDKPDTIRVGTMIIVKKKDGSGESHRSTEVNWKRNYRNKRITTSWALLDLGFSNFSDKTNYSSQATRDYTGNPATPLTKGDFSLRNGKSFDINVWIVRQRLGLTKNNKFNLTYAIGIETTNFRYENSPSYLKGAGPQYVKMDTISFKKNKLATSYLTVPVMLGFNTKPNGGGFTINVGASIGYLYSSRNKQISDERGKEKIKGNFGLEPWKLSYVGEIGVGGFKLYGSYAPKSIFKDGLDMRPYTIGVRLGGWD
jgi:hypothetical protein